jgi:uncharacterized protein YdiU (UPF0061 family)
MRKKLGLCTEENEDVNLVKRLLELMHEQGLDYTNTLRALSSIEDSSGMLQVSPKLAAWMQVWKERLAPERNSILFEQALETMRANNPVYIARNHLVEEAITAGVERGDFTVMDDLLRVLATPYQEQSNTRRYQEPAPASFAGYRTFCGT